MTATTRSCPSCSTTLPAEAQFCFHCGRATPTDPDVPPRTQATGEIEVAQVRKALIDRYVIERVLGEGGMATVYLAQDLKHKRKVAVKVMRPELAATLGADRFLREVEIAGQLSHPHVLPLFDSGAVGGILYYVMPFVDGETLRDRLAREGTLDPDEALRLTREVTDALAYAHRRGIIHRDIKPANIMMGEGHALVADFGIARALGDESGEALTRTGFAVGTPQYMSPEQAMGDKAVDARADIYATGAILYEMLTGAAPYTGKSAQAILTKSLTERPHPLASVRPGLPVGIEAMVEKSLARLPEDRYQTADELKMALDVARREMMSAAATVMPDATRVVGREEPARGGKGREGMGAARREEAQGGTEGAKRLRPWGIVAGVALLAAIAGFLALRGRDEAGGARGARGAPAAVTRIAVLPFVNEGAPSENFVAAGIADEVRGKLTQVEGLAIISSATASQYAGSGRRPQDVARELGADYLLLGRVRTTGEGAARRLQIVPELIDATTGQVRWTRTFDAAPEDVFSVQTDIASRVASSLGIESTGAAVTAAVEPPTKNVPAYEAYLRGLSFTSADPATQRQAAEYFEQAVALDPTFSDAWARLSIALARAVANGWADTSGARRGREAIAEARRLAPDAPLTLLASSRVAVFLNNDILGARRYAELALRASPNDPNILAVAATLDGSVGDRASERTKLERAHEIDPRNYATVLGLGQLYLSLGELARADDVMHQAVSIQPANPEPVQWHIIAKVARGDAAGARRVFQDAVERGVTAPQIAAQMAGFQETSWMLDETNRALTLRLRPSAFDNDVAFWSQSISTAYWQQGDTARARAYADSGLATSKAQSDDNEAGSQLHALYALLLSYRGRAAEARAEIATALRLDTLPAPNQAYLLLLGARVELALGNKEKALDYLERLQGREFYALPGILRQDPTYASLRGHPRFEKLVSR